MIRYPQLRARGTLSWAVGFQVVAAVLPAVARGADDYAAWAKVDIDGSWTVATAKAVAASELPTLVPSDIQKFCPAYSDRTVDDRQIFWVGLLSILARPESNFKPAAKYVEHFKDSKGENVISRGLLQISLESANQDRYSCGIAKAEDLHDASINLRCGVKILEAWVRADGIIATYGKDPPKGGGHYWSSFRETNKHLPELMSFTKKLAVCR